LRDSDGGFEGTGRQLAATLREAGAIALKTFQTPLRSWLKNQSSPVSEADIAVDGFLRERLAGPESGCGWLSEETADDRSSAAARRLWIVDPIDGTRSYLAGRPDWVISAALVVDGRPVLAGVFAPVSDELFVAAAGAGATRNGTPIRASAGDRLAGVKVAGPKRLLQALAAVDGQITVPPRIGSLALRLVRVAQAARRARAPGAAVTTARPCGQPPAARAHRQCAAASQPVLARRGTVRPANPAHPNAAMRRAHSRAGGAGGPGQYGRAAAPA
jgi:myo-inositol-1(or 4)-monophosphatase